MKLVIRVGGSVIGSPPNAPLIRKYITLLQDLKIEGHKIAAVVGGGSLARDFIEVATNLSEVHCSREYFTPEIIIN